MGEMSEEEFKDFLYDMDIIASILPSWHFGGRLIFPF